MGGYDIRVTALMAKCTVVADVGRTRAEMVELLRRQEAEAQRAQDAAQQEHLLLTNILARIDEQSQQMEVLRERQESIPRVGSSIVTHTSHVTLIYKTLNKVEP